MSSSIEQSVEILCKELNLERELVIEAMKDAVRAAARKQFKEDIQVEWIGETGEIEISANKIVVEDVVNPASELSIEEARELAGDEVEIGDALLIPLPMEGLGRIAAQTAKQILFQKVRDAVRSNVYDQYVDKIGDLMNGYIKRFERGDAIVDIGNNIESILPRQQQSRGENWNQGERIRVVISNVYKDAKGPQIEVSRSSPELLKRLFEMEVPEIYDGTVVVKSAVREPGERAKIAVTSTERDVDPVGACVGMKGSRVQSIIKELRGEKIDIIEWSEEPSIFAANALSPAKVNKVNITNIEKKQMEVIVNEDQLSLAIGKRGQNVRLATKLVGWNIDIRSEEELKKEIALQMGNLIASGEAVPLAAIQDVSSGQAEALEEHGITDIETLAATSVDDLVEYLDISLDEAETMINAAKAVIAAALTSAQPADEAASEEAVSDEAASEEATEKEPEESASTEEEEEETPVQPENETVEIAENLSIESEDEALANEDVSTAPDEVAEATEEEEAGENESIEASENVEEEAAVEEDALNDNEEEVEKTDDTSDENAAQK
jgi:transcription termination/antitermination protein NusA